MLHMLALSLLLVQPQGPVQFRDDPVVSTAVGWTMKYRVLLPDGYERPQERYHTLWLLHGLTGDCKDWSTRLTNGVVGISHGQHGRHGQGGQRAAGPNRPHVLLEECDQS